MTQRTQTEPPTATLSQALDESIARELRNRWGGRLPTWDEFKSANNAGRLRTNEGIAMKTIGLQGVPRSMWIMFGVVTPFAVFAAPAVSIILSIFGIIGWWAILLALLLSWYLYKVSLSGSADAIRYGAVASEPLYHYLVSRGAFLFEPE